MTATPGAKVADASALAAILFGEPDGPAIAHRLGGSQLLAPTLLDYEIGNIALKKIRRYPGQAAGFRAACALYRAMPIEIFPVEVTEVLDLAAATGLTYYDAGYLWLARRLGAELVTLDRQLLAAI